MSCFSYVMMYSYNLLLSVTKPLMLLQMVTDEFSNTSFAERSETNLFLSVVDRILWNRFLVLPLMLCALRLCMKC